MKREMRIVLAAVVMAMAVAGQGLGQQEQMGGGGGTAGSQAVLPLKKVVLYKHGVGYFERRGQVEGQQAIQLHFKKEQMSDILKSLTVLDLSGGQVGSIVYDSTRTAGQILQDYSFAIGEAMGLPQIFSQLQGSDAEILLGDKKLEGRIAGVESRTISHPAAYYLVILDDSGQLKNIPLSEVTGFRLRDDKLQKDVRDYLATVFADHRRDQKMLSISTTAGGGHDLLVSYVTESPIWKATYRVVLPGQGDDQKPFLQGWAVVDNVSDEDWQNVQLSLVSGLPISFVQNLYDPIYQKRPVIAVQEDAAMSPVLTEESMAMAPQAPASATAAPLVAAPPPAAPAKKRALKAMVPQGDMMSDKMSGGIGGGMGGGMVYEPAKLEEKMRQVEAETVTREVGDLFEYAIEQPVSIGKNQSALLPIVAKEIGGDAVSLYNESSRAKNPLSAVRLKNSTALTLEGGPLTVYQGNSYVGEALMKTVKPDELRYITYAVDLGVMAETKQDSKKDKIDRIVIQRGVMVMYRGIVETKTYNLNNKDKRNKIVVVEHPRRPEWKLQGEEKPIETTDNYLRFEVKIGAGENKSLAIEEEMKTQESIQVANITPDDILLYQKGKYITDQTRKQLEAIVAIKGEIVGLDRQLEQQKKNRDTIFQDQQRIRENLRSLRESTEERGLRSRYIGQMENQENQLGEIDKEIKGLQDQRESKQRELDSLILSLEQDVKM